jgi:hypothetical protein
MKQQFEKVGLANLGGGVLEELFGRELGQVLKNIEDPNTDAKAVRKISVEVSIKPNENRDFCAVTVSCKSSLPGVKAHDAAFFLGREGGKLVAYENNMKQDTLPLGQNVTSIGGANA